MLHTHSPAAVTYVVPVQATEHDTFRHGNKCQIIVLQGILYTALNTPSLELAHFYNPYYKIKLAQFEICPQTDRLGYFPSCNER